VKDDKIHRREFLKFLGVSASSIALAPSALLNGCAQARHIESLTGIKPTLKDDLILAPGLSSQVLISWEDALTDQLKFGFNNDYLALRPLSNGHFIMWSNHEYVNPLFVSGKERNKTNIDKERASVGGSLFEIKNVGGQWQVVKNSPYNRGVRGDTPIPFAGGRSIAGSTSAIGTLGNCAGGITPWGTFLTCEENYQDYYGERNSEGKIETSDYAYQWQKVYPLPPEHYGWVVEVVPETGEAKKHINLGRMAHECATCIRAKDGRAVAYTGDDKNDEHLYKFVAEDRMSQFDEGTLYVADLKKQKWIPLDLKNPQLAERFKTHEQLMINCREAAKMVGATPLDRPEDIEIHPYTGDVFVALTNNKPKGNYHGSILKISEKDSDHGSLSFTASTFYMGGKAGGLSCPDNLSFDRSGNLWVATDISGSKIGKGTYQPFGNNGLFVIPTSGPQAGMAIQVASAPVEAELTGLCFSPDFKTLFVSVQHPGEKTKDLARPTSQWPTGKTPRPSVVAITGSTLEKIVNNQS
jgi:hypothetical protein